MTLGKGHLSAVCQHFQRTEPLKLLDRFQIFFIYTVQDKGEQKSLYTWSRSHDSDGRKPTIAEFYEHYKNINDNKYDNDMDINMHLNDTDEILNSYITSDEENV